MTRSHKPISKTRQILNHLLAATAPLCAQDVATALCFKRDDVSSAICGLIRRKQVSFTRVPGKPVRYRFHREYPAQYPRCDRPTTLPPFAPPASVAKKIAINQSGLNA